MKNLQVDHKKIREKHKVYPKEIRLIESLMANYITTENKIFRITENHKMIIAYDLGIKKESLMQTLRDLKRKGILEKIDTREHKQKTMQEFKFKEEIFK